MLTFVISAALSQLGIQTTSVIAVVGLAIGLMEMGDSSITIPFPQRDVHLFGESKSS